jgi:hypothetical protein
LKKEKKHSCQIKKTVCLNCPSNYFQVLRVSGSPCRLVYLDSPTKKKKVHRQQCYMDEVFNVKDSLSTTGGCNHLSSGSLDLLLSLSTFTETVLETAGDVLEVTHAASTGGLSALRLDGPVDYEKDVSMVSV